MKTIRSIIAAALTLILTAAFILFPDLYYRRDENGGTMRVRKIDVIEIENGSAALSEQEIFAALLNENSERSLCYFSEIPDSKQNDCYITARKMIREILFEPSLRAYSYFIASEGIRMDMKKLRYLTLSENTENGDIQTIDLIFVSVGSGAVCYEEKSNLPVFFTVSATTFSGASLHP